MSRALDVSSLRSASRRWVTVPLSSRCSFSLSSASILRGRSASCCSPTSSQEWCWGPSSEPSRIDGLDRHVSFAADVVRRCRIRGPGCRRRLWADARVCAPRGCWHSGVPASQPRALQASSTATALTSGDIALRGSDGCRFYRGAGLVAARCSSSAVRRVLAPGSTGPVRTLGLAPDHAFPSAQSPRHGPERRDTSVASGATSVRASVRPLGFQGCDSCCLHRRQPCFAAALFNVSELLLAKDEFGDERIGLLRPGGDLRRWLHWRLGCRSTRRLRARAETALSGRAPAGGDRNRRERPRSRRGGRGDLLHRRRATERGCCSSMSGF